MGFIFCIFWWFGEVQSMEIVCLVVCYYGQGVVGFDIVGDEVNYELVLYIFVFQYVYEKGILVMVYVGEVWGLESVWEFMKYFYLSWIGYGVCIIEDLCLMDEVWVVGLYLEICFMSNIQIDIYLVMFDYVVY